MRRSIVSSLSLTPEAWERTRKLMRLENRSRSAVICEAVEKYYTMKQWQALQIRGARAAKTLGITDEDGVERLVHEFRKRK